MKYIFFLITFSSLFSYSTESVKNLVIKQQLSILPQVRLDSLITMMNIVSESQIEGDFLEAGAMKGGACMVMKAFCLEKNIAKKLYVADSFKGFPKTIYNEEAYVNNITYPFVVVSAEECKKNFQLYHLLDKNVIFLEGFFNETLPTANINSLSILRIDCDMYQSTLDVLTNLYDKVSENGFIIIDDYGDFPFCKKAVDEFRATITNPKEIIWIDNACVYWRK